MKRLFPLVYSLVLCALFTACFSSNEYLIESDYSYDGTFDKYRSFDFVKAGAEADSAIRSPVIEEAIRRRMSIQGYRQANNDPNLLISYRVYYKDFDFKGYRQPEIEAFVNQTSYEEEEKYKAVKYKLQEGTLLILLFDRTKEKSVWQGYASGLFGGDSEKSNRNIKRAVKSIFDRYKFLANGFGNPESLN